jgi:hypothetical protein
LGPVGKITKKVTSNTSGDRMHQIKAAELRWDNFKNLDIIDESWLKKISRLVSDDYRAIRRNLAKINAEILTEIADEVMAALDPTQDLHIEWMNKLIDYFTYG